VCKRVKRGWVVKALEKDKIPSIKNNRGEDAKKQSYADAIPEFKRFNILYNYLCLTAQ